MATTSENGSSLADRLMKRSARASRIGSRKGIFERFGLESPYEGGAVGNATTQTEMFSFLSSKAYFDEIRGLSAMRRHLLWRISAVRHRLRVGEGLRTAIATSAVRAAMLGYDPILVDWSTQLDLEDAGLEEGDETGVAVAAARRMRAPQRRQTAAERALRAQISSASDVLANLESLANASVSDQKQIVEEAEAVSQMPARRQPAAARRVTRRLRGAAKIAARGTGLDRSSTALGERPLAVAQARDNFMAPKGLRRVLEDSPIVMTLEQPEPIAPEAEEPAAVQTATRRPVARQRAHREVPVAPVAREARTQASTGRAGPPAEERTQRVARPVAPSRPTERLARTMRLEEAAPLTDTRRGLRASLRSPVEVESAGHALERRVAARSEAGIPDESGRVVNSTGYVREARQAPLGLNEEGRVTRTMALAADVPFMSPISTAEPEAVASDESPEAAPTAPPRSTGPSRAPVRARTHKTPESQTERSQAFRTPSSQTATSQGFRTDSGSTPTSELHRTRRSPATGSRRNVSRALPPMARAIHRSVDAPPVAQTDSRVAIARAPVTAPTAVDRRQVGVSRQLADAVVRESVASRSVSPVAELGASGPARRQTDAVQARLDAAPGTPADAPRRTLDAAAAPEMNVALPASPDAEPESTETESAQRAVVSTGSSRRGRALPTVRAASRALAQERLGARGRLLSPSSTAHLQVTEPDEALADAPVRTGLPHLEARLDRGMAPSREAAAPVLPETTLATLEPVSAEPEVEAEAPVARVARRAEAPRRGAAARASERDDDAPRIGPTGAMVAPRAVTPFVDAPAERTLARVQDVMAQAERSIATRLASRDEVHTAPTSQGTEGRTRVGASPAELTLALPETPVAAAVEDEAPRSGLAARATRRAPARPTRRSVVPDVTPEAAKSHDRQTRTAVGTSQPVRTESGRVVPSNTLRTDVSPTERSLAWRTPRSYVARTVSMRTPESQTEASEAFRTATRAVERSQAFRTQTRTAALTEVPAAVSEASFLESGADTFVEEVDPEGGVARATRRLDARRETVADSAMSWLEKRQDVVEPESAEVTQTSRALGRAAVRREAGSVVPHPVGSAETDRATTRMLAGPERVFAAAENVILDGDEAIPAASVGSTPARRAAERSTPTRDFAPTERAAAPARRVASAVAGLTDGMTLAAPTRAEAPEAATSVAGGVRAVAPRPGAPSRSRLDRALRAAASVSASTRAENAVLTLPSGQRQLDDSAPREFEARVRVDADGRVVQATVEDVVSGASLALPPRATSAEWAEEREQRSVQPRTQRERAVRASRDASGTFVPSLRAIDVDDATVPQRAPAFSALDSTLDSLATPLGAPAPSEAPTAARRPLMRRRAWTRRGMAAELGMIAPTLKDADYAPVQDVPEDAPSWARRAVKGTGVAGRNERLAAEAPETTVARPDGPVYAPNSLMGALARTERPEDLVKIILDRGGREASVLRNELPNEAVSIVEQIVNLSPEEQAFLRSGRRVIEATPLSGAPTRQSRGQTNAPELHQLSAGKEGVGANRIMKLADKLMGLIHLAENARGNEARDQVRLADDSNEARAEGGIQIPGMSVEDAEMNIEALQKNVLNSVMEYMEELDSRREDPDGRNKWW